jgi:predicted phage terminase large subunit-like protein
MYSTPVQNLKKRLGRPPNISAEDAAAELLKRRKARNHIVNFAEYTHPQWQTGEHHKIICDHLEALERRDIERLMIHAPPRHSKSELASRRFPAWYMGRHPGNQVLLTSYGDEIAEDLSRNVRNIMRDPYFHALFPDVQLAADTTAAGRWETTAGGIFVAVGIGGAATGRGAHLGIIDDPLKGRADADSPRTRQIIWEWYHGVFRTRLMKGSCQLLMMTRWHESDLAGQLLETEGKYWSVLNLEGIANEGTDHEKELWPEMYPIEVLSGLRRDLASAGRLREWKAQYQQKPTAEEGIFIKREWMRNRFDEKPPHLNVYIASDFAVTEAEENRDPDWTVHGVFGVDPENKIHVLDWWRGRTTPDVWIDSLIDMLLRWKPRTWFGEKGPIRRSIETFLTKRMLERRCYANMEWIASVKDKAARARSLQALASMGRITWPKNQPWVDEAIENIVGFPTVKHDDDFDVIALMCLAIDEAHPAVVGSVAQKKKVDPWKHHRAPKCDQWKTI